jgi:hypothetical protein
MYVKVTNGAVDQYPYTVGDLRRDNPNTSFPRQISSDTLASYGLYEVTILDRPSYTERTQNLTQKTTPTLNGDNWELGWTVSDKTSDETQAYDDLVAQENRAVRDNLISVTDFYALSDVTMSAEMTTYRQALRDITSHANWPHLNDDDWPTKP